MRKSVFSRELAGILLLAVGIVCVCGCGKKSGIYLGPKPATYALEEQAWKGPMVDNMRAWLQTLDPQSAQTLKQTGQIAFAFAALATSDPEHKKMIEDYARIYENRYKEKMAERGVFVGFVPQEVTFKALEGRTGAYEFVIDFGGGHFSNLILSEPL
jgi:hypothetical protein